MVAGDDDTCVVRKSNIERYVEENCVMTVTAQATTVSSWIHEIWI